MSGLVSVVNLPPPVPCRTRLPPLAGRRKYRDVGGGESAPPPRRRVAPPPPPPRDDGRVHRHVQTELYLEELWEYPVTHDVACQTDLFVERPLSPVYVPAKTGLDADTQILPGELFDFDEEVLPILEVLADKTMEQALIEVLEEEEMAELLCQQRRYLAARDVELAEQQRLEEQERRLREETDRSIAEARDAHRHQAEAKERVAAAALVRGHLDGLLPSVLRGLADAGVLVDDVRADVVDGFLPWLTGHVERRVGSSVQGRMVLDDILKQILIEQRRVYSELGERRLAEEEMTLLEPPHIQTSPAETSRPERSPAESTNEEPSVAPLDPADIRDQSSEPEATPVAETSRLFSDISEEPEEIEDD